MNQVDSIWINIWFLLPTSMCWIRICETGQHCFLCNMFLMQNGYSLSCKIKFCGYRSRLNVCMQIKWTFQWEIAKRTQPKWQSHTLRFACSSEMRRNARSLIVKCLRHFEIAYRSLLQFTGWINTEGSSLALIECENSMKCSWTVE